MVDEIVKQLLEAGVHFGHPTKRWNPKMKKYIFGHKAGVYIIDLEKTVECLNRARDFLVNLASEGKLILFVGTKKQAQGPIQEEAQRCGMYYINQRWLGGLLTNFNTIKKRINRFKELEKMKNDGTFEIYSKKEAAMMSKELERLRKNFSGIVDMPGIPDAVYLIDTTKESTALREAKRLKLPTVALIDTNCAPDEVTYPIPGNDDAMRAIKLITNLVAESILEGKKRAGISAPVQKEEVNPESEEIKIDEVIQEEAELIEEKVKEEVEEKQERPKPTHQKRGRPREKGEK